jgi:hypothetical protein
MAATLSESAETLHLLMQLYNNVAELRHFRGAISRGLASGQSGRP